MSPDPAVTSGPAPREASPAQVRQAVAQAVAGVPGVSLVVPLRKEALRLAGGDRTMAVTVSDDLVEVRLLVHRLPLPPLLERVDQAARGALDATRSSGLRLRLRVTGLSQAAFDDR